MNAAVALPLPAGDHEGLEGFRVLGPSAEEIGFVAAVERIASELTVVVGSGRHRRTYRTVPWSGVARINLVEQTISLNLDGLAAFASGRPQTVRRTNSEPAGIVRYVPGPASLVTDYSTRVAPSSTRAFVTILLASLATPAILGAGALATTSNSRAAWVLLAVALAALGGSLFVWPAATWLAHRRHPGTTPDARTSR